MQKLSIVSLLTVVLGLSSARIFAEDVAQANPVEHKVDEVKPVEEKPLEKDASIYSYTMGVNVGKQHVASQPERTAITELPVNKEGDFDKPWPTGNDPRAAARRLCQAPWDSVCAATHPFTYTHAGLDFAIANVYSTANIQFSL